MVRQHLRHVLAVLVAALAVLAPSSAAQVPELRACWLTHYSYVGKTEPQLRAIAQNIKAGNMNMVYVGMYSGQQTMWPSKAYQAAGGTWVSNTVDWARDMCRIMREEGLLVGAWDVGHGGQPIGGGPAVGERGDDLGHG